MKPSEISPRALCGVYVDMGTTHTRAWLMRGGEVIARARVQAGAADSARDKSREKILAGLKQLIENIRTGKNAPSPAFCIAAGMITSSLGLVEMPHLAAPVGEPEISAAVQRFLFPEIVDLPFFLVPGVRSGFSSTLQTPRETDLIRGEETLCIGLLNSGGLKPGATLLTLGSHWKAICLDERGRIKSSISSLSGELLDAARTQTILANSVAQTWPAHLNDGWLDAGIDEQRKAGLARALYCVRMLQLDGKANLEDCFAFFCGAFIGADIDKLLLRQVLEPNLQVTIAGSPALGNAWQHALARSSIPSTLLSENDREQALLAGLHTFAISGHQRETRA